jgi:hypothetical protein
LKHRKINTKIGEKMAWSFINHLTEYISRSRLGNQKQPTLWPSEASVIVKNEYDEEINLGKCRRAIFFRYLFDNYLFYKKYAHYESLVNQIQQESSDPDKYMRWIWIQGNLYEDYLLNTAKESGVYIADQVAVYIPSHNVSGKIDIVTINPETEKHSIVEAKSVYGFNANFVLGTPSQRKEGKLGTPKDSYLMQLGLYQYWYGNKNDNFEEATLVCGARDTGRFAEYKIKVEPDPDKENEDNYIWYKAHFPNSGPFINSNISIEQILKQYKYIQDCLDSGDIPKRDFDLKFSDSKIDTLYERGLLNKSETARYEKRKKQIEENKTRVNKQIEKGDWQCNYCQYQTICYDRNSNEKEVSI